MLFSYPLSLLPWGSSQEKGFGVEEHGGYYWQRTHRLTCTEQTNKNTKLTDYSDYISYTKRWFNTFQIVKLKRSRSNTCVRHPQIGERAERSEKRRREISVRGGEREGMTVWPYSYNSQGFRGVGSSLAYRISPLSDVDSVMFITGI